MREYEFIGIPLEPPPLPKNYEPDEEETGPSTAEIIANQSQDYIDEKLAEYQATIYLLQGEWNFYAEKKISVLMFTQMLTIFWVIFIYTWIKSKQFIFT